MAQYHLRWCYQFEWDKLTFASATAKRETDQGCNHSKNVQKDPPAERIIINFGKIMGMDGPLKRVKDFTQEEYTNRLLASGGKEHYAFLNYLLSTYGDCRCLIDIGTRFVTSALAVGSNQR